MGLGIGGLGDPVYVLRLDPVTRRVVVGPREALATTVIRVAEINWLGDGAFEGADEWPVAVRVRSTRPPAEAVVRPVSAAEAEVELLAPETGVSPGQACVFYAREGSRVLGGGWIRRGT
jgi:tRNA-specific 2-thiouridylase